MEDAAIIERLSAVAHATRLKVFRLLVRAGADGLASGEIARRLAVPATTMSTHLAVLARAGLIAARRESRTIYYALEPKTVRGLFDALVSDCCDGRPELCAPLMGRRGGVCVPKPSTTRRR